MIPVTLPVMPKSFPVIGATATATISTMDIFMKPNGGVSLSDYGPLTNLQLNLSKETYDGKSNQRYNSSTKPA